MLWKESFEPIVPEQVQFSWSEYMGLSCNEAGEDIREPSGRFEVKFNLTESLIGLLYVNMPDNKDGKV